jgi:probable O-glycosylation ligase (exosortase A-associated)
MRDFLLVVVMLGSAPICLVNPSFGVMMWYWVSYFNPHRFTWSYGYNLPVAFIIAVPTLVGTVFGQKSLRSLAVRESLLLVLLWVWFAFTYLHARGVALFALHMDQAEYEMVHISKILLMTFVMIIVITTSEKLRWVMLVTGGSLGLLAVKGTLFGLREGGARISGPPNSFLDDNNALGLALNMCIPILFFLAREEKNTKLKWFLRICFLCAILGVILTYSRGGLLGLAVVVTAITLKTRHKVAGAFFMVVAAFLILTFAPSAWMDRMSRFAKGDLDSSANERLVAWETAWHFAHDYPLTGGGFNTLPDETVFQRYQLRPLPEGFKSTAPHSIYFQLLADHGFIGLALFLAVIASCFWSLRRVRRVAQALPVARHLINYTHMIEVAVLGFMVSGAFLGFVYLDVIYQMVGTVVVLKVLLRNELALHLHHAEAKESSLSMEEALAPV